MVVPPVIQWLGIILMAGILVVLMWILGWIGFVMMAVGLTVILVLDEKFKK